MAAVAIRKFGRINKRSASEIQIHQRTNTSSSVGKLYASPKDINHKKSIAPHLTPEQSRKTSTAKQANYSKAAPLYDLGGSQLSRRSRELGLKDSTNSD